MDDEVIGRIEIYEPYLIVVEGKTDKYFLELIIDFLSRTLKFPKIQIIYIGGKENLRHFANKVILSDVEVKAILIVLDKDDNYKSTEDKINDFFKRLNMLESLKIKEKIIIPPSNMEGKEFEDYLVHKLKEAEKQNINVIEKCIKEFSKTGQKKYGKKVLYTYLLINDDCKYSGISINKETIRKCLINLIPNLTEISNVLKSFLLKLKEIENY